MGGRQIVIAGVVAAERKEVFSGENVELLQLVLHAVSRMSEQPFIDAHGAVLKAVLFRRYFRQERQAGHVRQSRAIQIEDGATPPQLERYAVEDGKTDVEDVLAQMPILPEGYFVGVNGAFFSQTTSAWGKRLKPVSF